jgi:hypothetical protein
MEKEIMKLLTKIQKYVAKKSATGDFCIQTIRFRELLEKTQALMHLVDDGQEKLSGEYILDFHYIASLIENIINNLGLLVFNACVLVPEGGEALYISYDAHRSKAGDMLLTATVKPDHRPSSANTDSPVSADPEYDLLKDVLAWCRVENDDPESSVTAFVAQIFSHVMAEPHPLLSSLAQIPVRTIVSGKITNRIMTLDLFEGIHPSKTPFGENIECLPLRLMELGAGMGGADANGAREVSTREWLAIVDDQRVSLRLTIGADLILKVEASVTGNLSADYIFVYFKEHLDPESIVPKEFRMQKCQYGWLAWKFDMPEKMIEDNLVLLGKNIFCNLSQLF